MMASIWLMMASYGSRCGQHRLRMLYDGTHMAFVCCMMAFLLSICVGCVLCGVRVCGVSFPATWRWLVAIVVLLVVVGCVGFEYLCWVCVEGGEGLWGQLSSYFAMASSICSGVRSGRVRRSGRTIFLFCVL